MNLLERSLEEVKWRTKVIGRFPGETSCLSLCRTVLDLFIASARGLASSGLEHRQLVQMSAVRTTQTPKSYPHKMALTARLCRHFSSADRTRPRTAAGIWTPWTIEQANTPTMSGAAVQR